MLSSLLAVGDVQPKMEQDAIFHRSPSCHGTHPKLRKLGHPLLYLDRSSC
jgi:hypothetical protein